MTDADKLTPEQEVALMRVCSAARREGGRHAETLADRSKVYAYRGAGDVYIHWGVSGDPHGFCIARGTTR